MYSPLPPLINRRDFARNVKATNREREKEKGDFSKISFETRGTNMAHKEEEEGEG